MACVLCTTFVKEESVAISSGISMFPALPIPPPERGLGARRVHNTTLSSFGYPEATPSVKGLRGLVLMQLLLRVPRVLTRRLRRACKRVVWPLNPGQNKERRPGPVAAARPAVAAALSSAGR